MVLSRVTSLDGLFLLQPIKENYNPQPSKLLRDEWKNQREREIELLLFLQKSGNFPEDVNVHDVALKLNHGTIAKLVLEQSGDKPLMKISIQPRLFCC